MNNKEIIKLLIDELKELKTRMNKDKENSNKNGYMPKQYLMHYDFKDTMYYNIITNDGKCYSIDCTTREFPNIDFNNIVYIYKKLTNIDGTHKSFYTIKRLYDTIDTINGKFYANKMGYDYLNNIRNKFNVTEMIGFERD